MRRLTRREMLKTAAGAGLMGMTPVFMNGCGSTSSAGTSDAGGVILRVPFGPTAVKQGNDIVFGYELLIGRALSLGLVVTAVEILRDGPEGDMVKRYQGAE